MHNVIANGAAIPALGFGTFRMSDAEVAEVLPEALKLGFRHVDTAQVYGNEAAVGAAIRASGVPRDEVFLTTKVWVTEFAEADLLPSVEESLKKLGVDHVDLLLLHWPHGNDTPREVQIAELNKTVSKGMTRHIGVSNYNVAGMHEAAELSCRSIALIGTSPDSFPWMPRYGRFGPAVAGLRGLHGCRPVVVCSSGSSQRSPKSCTVAELEPRARLPT